jgi:hypothetical protein
MEEHDEIFEALDMQREFFMETLKRLTKSVRNLAEAVETLRVKAHNTELEAGELRWIITEMQKKFGFITETKQPSTIGGPTITRLVGPADPWDTVYDDRDPYEEEDYLPPDPE